MALEPGTLTAPKPVEPVRQFSFTDFQVANPTLPPPGDRLDAEFDRANTAIGDTIAWVDTSLNSDGTLRAQIVGKPQLVPGLFDDIADDAVAEVQPLVDQAQSYASQAGNSASGAAASATLAGTRATAAGQSATTASGAATTATTAAGTAQGYVSDASSAATRASNDANHADGAAATAQAYADVGMAWAEYMPDTIPPNILAVMGVTGDHWSSRWWANKTNQDGAKILAAIQRFYLGAFVTPPSTDNQGNPIAVGAMYYDLTLQAMYVWTGASWRPAAGYSPAKTFRYVYIATAAQTVFTGTDRNGNPLTYDPASGQDVQVHENGVLRTPDNDYTLTANTVTMLQAGQAGDIVQIMVESVPVVKLDWRTARLDTSGWVFNGTQATFALKDPQNVALILTAASDVFLSLDGVWQQATVDYNVASSSLTFATAPPAGSVAFGVAIVPVPDVVAPQPGVTRIDTTAWVLNGTNVTFPIKDFNGTAISPVAAENLLLSVNGVWQAAVRDYTTSGATVTFVTAPEAAAVVFGVAGLPAFGATA